ncbi:hypothetical protein TIFTF001_039874 [Ficus carica]|uniref:Uncharacterized protein n=1 Tax=Ficus carica TaxID=3494 RepID=A0AA87Z7Z3_FICCA|nr:hypothetical protein TIFTF001_039874 [Ficus carica]
MDTSTSSSHPYFMESSPPRRAGFTSLKPASNLSNYFCLIEPSTPCELSPPRQSGSTSSNLPSPRRTASSYRSRLSLVKPFPPRRLVST